MDTIFPKTRKLLDQVDIEYIGLKESIAEFESVVDWFYAIAFDRREEVMEYYDDNGPRAIQKYSRKELREMDKAMALLLTLILNP
jgi:hypothetical protein